MPTDVQPIAPPDQADEPQDDRPLFQRLLPIALVYGVSRLATFIAASLVYYMHPKVKPPITPLMTWDAGWYLSIIDHGYAKSVPPGHGAAAQANIAFFPAYPVTVRFLSDLTGLSSTTCAIFLSVVTGLFATLLVWLIAAKVTDRDTADRSAVLFCFFPGAFVLSMGYSEGVFILGAAGCVYALMHQRWLLAGIAGAISTAGRPTGMVLGLCAAWAAFEAIRKHRDWWSLIAPALTPIGLIGYFAYLEVHTGTYRSWFETEERGWFGQKFDFGVTNVKRIWHMLDDPLTDPNTLYAMTPILLVVVGAWLVWKWRPPALILIYTVGMVGIPIGSSQLWSTLRYLLAAFPLVIAYARVLRGTGYAVAVGVSGTFMLYFLMLTAVPNAFIP